MNTILKSVTHNAAETVELGQKLGTMLKKGDVVLLIGDLGTGKTTIAKGIVSSLNDIHPDFVTSPSFTLMQDYQGSVPVVHVDLYRLNDPREISEIGIDDVIEESVIVIEWGDRVLDWFDNPYIVELHWIGESIRNIEIKRNQ
ncbi:MAG: tRNA (adenosine(37)-N6)-threonylcarbamoyltransferase complex ATPase subunit type 1 TsaE [Candidatus Schekmanbacteria bacterium RBG_13_48_7]|uniref:tRNA threonylcarbamoyladenosine biosynthesis protein TsaE n=1 Tax=Candidatus Schekmanbacteria bacterium RBG_13_48_7 TaxID=1817878 RepID=A0A1F7S0B0_9BACT|nr:MAG: tRNA (adenosine(37)-N6)-threonylcarbamoyltransferase complex ATPase subunit type 1 TsaE [Candidatus Schekmanbacteria bacterium RBG_13_48_7]